MKILAIDSSGLVASAAIMADGVLAAEFTTNFKKTHSQTLLPMIDQIVTTLGIDLKGLDAIAVSSGPGSFTGLRIGSSTAKGLGLVLKKPIIPVPTLEGLAANLYGTDRLICPIMDARRNQVYTAVFCYHEEELVTVSPQKAVSVLELIGELNGVGREVIFLGDGVPVYKDIINQELKTGHSYAPAHLAVQRAGAIAMRAEKYLAEGRTESAAEHKPEYLRLSQAERERMEKLNQSGESQC